MYYVITDPGYRDADLMRDSNGFLETFMEYQTAKDAAEEDKGNGDLRTYAIVAFCSDERNYVI